MSEDYLFGEPVAITQSNTATAGDSGIPWRLTMPTHTAISLGCAQCGGTLAEIRGRYPGTERRMVCPTCLMEKLEQIQEIASPDYGKASQSKSE